MTARKVDVPVDDLTLFAPDVAARVARVPVAFVELCEREELIETQVVVGGRRGFRRSAIRTLMRVRHLHEDLGLDLDAVDLVLRMQSRITSLRDELAAMEARLADRERAFQAEIQQLRQRLASRSSED